MPGSSSTPLLVLIAQSTFKEYWWRLGWLQLVVLLILTLWPEVRLPGPQGTDKFSHLLSFAWLMCWFAQVVEQHRGRLVLALITYGALIEVLQYFSGYRMGELADLAADAAGVLIGWGIVHFLLPNLFRKLEVLRFSRTER